MPWHNLAHFCCANICCSKFGLFLISPSPVTEAPTPSRGITKGRCAVRRGRRSQAHTTAGARISRKGLVGAAALGRRGTRLRCSPQSVRGPRDELQRSHLRKAQWRGRRRRSTSKTQAKQSGPELGGWQRPSPKKALKAKSASGPGMCLSTGGGGGLAYCSRLQLAAPVGRSPFAATLRPSSSSLPYLSLSTSLSFPLASPSTMGGGGLADPPTHTENQKRFPLWENEILNRKPNDRPILSTQTFFFALIPTHPRPMGRPLSTTLPLGPGTCRHPDGRGRQASRGGGGAKRDAGFTLLRNQMRLGIGHTIILEPALWGHVKRPRPNPPPRPTSYRRGVPQMQSGGP